MTHKTGPRRHIVDRLEYDIRTAIIGAPNRPTMSEAVTALMHSALNIVHEGMGPKLADKLCPTCPKRRPRG